MVLFALDWIPGILIGGLLGAAAGGIAYSVDWGVRALWRCLRKSMAGRPANGNNETGAGVHETGAD
jgi:hypothetical protein